MILKVSGNKESFQLNKTIKPVSWSIDSQFQPYLSFSANLSNDEQNAFLSSQILYQISNELKRVPISQVPFIAQRFVPSFDIAKNISSATPQENAIFKSLFLIFYELEYYIATYNSQEILQNTSDHFMIDYSGKPEIQYDIYFIKRQYIYQENLPLIDRLINLNLLVKFEILNFQTEITAYFIPLVKPGVSLIHFKSEYDKTGQSTYSLWKRILEDRDFKIRTWFSNKS